MTHGTAGARRRGPFPQIAPDDFESPDPDFAFQLFGFPRLAETTAQRDRLRNSGHVLPLVRGAALQRKLLRTDDGFGVGEGSGLLSAASGGLHQRMGFGELRLAALRHFQSLVERQRLKLVAGRMAEGTAGQSQQQRQENGSFHRLIPHRFTPTFFNPTSITA